MQERLNRLYEQYGYRKFKMSRFEDYDLYAQNRDFLRQDRIITFTDADGALKALKPDITLSIMKSNGGDSEKVYYNENVCREVGGAFREILQVGVESVGQIDPYAEAEVIVLAAKSLRTISEDYVLDLSDVSFVGGLLDCMGLTGIRRERVLALLAQKNVPGIQAMAGQGELQRRDADDLVQLMEQMLDEMTPSFVKNELQVEFLHAEHAIFLEADGELLARLFGNLLNNAVKYGKEGKQIRVSMEKEGEYVVTRVINYGRIIPKQELDHIFQKFYRTEQSRSRDTGGTGLGLAIVQQIAELHHGQVRVKSDLQGTVFEVELPVGMPKGKKEDEKR